MGLIAAFGIGRGMANQYQVDGTSAGVLAVSAWLILTPNILSEEGQGIPVTYLGQSRDFHCDRCGINNCLDFSMVYSTQYCYQDA